MDAEFLRPREVARLVGLHVRTVRESPAWSALPWVKMSPRCWRVRRDDLERFLGEHREAA